MDLKSKEGGKDQESIQSSNTYDHDTIEESDKTTMIHHTSESQEVSPFPSGDHTTARIRQDGIVRINVKHKLQKRSTKDAPPWNIQ